ncbi:MAG: protein-export chaperone SecB [Pseudomonadales bacterium]|nr:protein-export chaperone SecB [Pseudomonadales bacterium]
MSEAVQVQLRIERIYVKDASFESPGAPSIFTQQFKPEMKVDINTNVNSLGDDRHEVVLSATVNAMRSEENHAYIVEVQQAGIFVIEGAEGGTLRQVLGIACPNALFPYLRETLDTLVTKGGFPPLHLAPVNFEMLYSEAMRQAGAQGESIPSAGETQH